MSTSEDEEAEFGKCPFSWKPSGNDPFSANLFVTFKGTPINFFVYDDSISKERIEDLIVGYGGSIATSIVEPSTIILVQEKFNPPKSWGPVYSRQYIKDCITTFKLLDLNKYLIEDCVPQAHKNVTNGIFQEDLAFRPSSLFTTYFTKKCKTYEKENVEFTCSSNLPHDHQTTIHSELDVDQNCPVIKSSTTQMYKKSKTSNNVHEDNQDCTTLVHDSKDDSENSLGLHNPCSKQRVLEHTNSVTDKICLESELNSDNQISKKRKLPFPAPSTSDETESLEVPNSNKNTSTIPTTTKDSNQRPVSSDSDDSLPDFSNFSGLKKFSIVNKHSRHKFNKAEKESILKYIIAKKAFGRLKSDALYREMEERNICPKRTYQSMKNHLIKTILQELDTFTFLTDSDKRKLKGEIW